MGCVISQSDFQSIIKLPPKHKNRTLTQIKKQLKNNAQISLSIPRPFKQYLLLEINQVWFPKVKEQDFCQAFQNYLLLLKTQAEKNVQNNPINKGIPTPNQTNKLDGLQKHIKEIVKSAKDQMSNFSRSLSIFSQLTKRFILEQNQQREFNIQKGKGKLQEANRKQGLLLWPSVDDQNNTAMKKRMNHIIDNELQKQQKEQKEKGKQRKSSKSLSKQKINHKDALAPSKVAKSYFFFYYYLIKWCIHLQQTGSSLKQINQKLTNILQFVNAKYMKSIHSQKDPEEPNGKFNILKLIFEEGLNFIKSEVFQVGYETKKLQCNGQDKERMLDYRIQRLMQEAKDSQQYFKDFFSKLCKLYQGSDLVTGLKLKSMNNKTTVDRIKQKIMLREFKKINFDELNSETKTMKQLNVFEWNRLKSSLKNKLDKADQVQMRLSDMLRGKCKFDEINNLNDAVSHVLDHIKSYSTEKFKVELIEVDNRLKKMTSDIVLKIKINHIICQFKMLFLVSEQSEIFHKSYELLRSKMLSPLTVLMDRYKTAARDFLSYIKFESKKNRGEHKKLEDELRNTFKILYEEKEEQED